MGALALVIVDNDVEDVVVLACNTRAGGSLAWAFPSRKGIHIHFMAPTTRTNCEKKAKQQQFLMSSLRR